ncbi:MAG: peptidase M56 [Burkholderiales bacterium]|nr:peptidase M56 [Flavobacterium sp.]
MEALFYYFLKASALTGLFFTAYCLLLRKETFFKSNRWFLLSGLFTSVLLPLLTFQKVVWVDTLPQAMDWNNLPVNEGLPAADYYEINWAWVLVSVYLIGMFLFLFKFCSDYSHLVKTLNSKITAQQSDFKFIDVEEKVAPFSYFNYIVYNSSLYSDKELDHIFEHEKVHCQQNHSADVLISNIFCIMFWYNPFVWFYRKAILQNLEFIADSVALKNIADKKAYQITLLKVTTHDNCVVITNHFYQSLIKKRIIMLNKNQSRKRNSWKYALIVPVLTGFLLYFQVKVIAQERNFPNAVSVKSLQESVDLMVDKNTSDAEIKKEVETLKAQHGIKLKFSKISRNLAGEIIAIKATYKDNDGKTGMYQVSAEAPISPFHFFKNEDGTTGFGNTNQIQIVKRGRTSNTLADQEVQVVTTVGAERAESPEAPELPEANEAPEAPEPPVHPGDGKRVLVKNTKGNNGVISVTVNGETVEIDVDKIVAEATADMNFDFAFNSDDVDKIVRGQMHKLKIQMEKLRPQMEKARMKMERMKPEYGEHVKTDMEQARRDIEQSKRDLEQSKLDLEQSKLDLEQSKRDFEQQKTALEKMKKNQ